MSNDMYPDERVNKKIKLDLDCDSFSSSKERLSHEDHATKFPATKPVAVLPEEYTRENIDTVQVYVAEIRDPKFASRCIRELKALFPLKDLQHLKRIKRTPAGNKQALQIILRPVYEKEFEKSSKNMLDVAGIVEGVCPEGMESPFIISVPENQPLTRKQFIQASELWPVNFHEDKYITKLLSGELFDDLALRKINKYMEMARKSAVVGESNGMVAMGAVIVDPSNDNVIAMAYDLRCHGHPLCHAVMVVIDLVAQSQSGGTWNMGYQLESGAWILPENFNNIQINEDKSNLESEEVWKEASKCQTSQESSNEATERKTMIENDDRNNTNNQGKKLITDNKKGPYLCTGYDLYVTKEPCVMCAMALVHSRIRRVFCGSKDPRIGALGSKYQLHVQDGLNHHFEVFCGVLEKECSDMIT